MITLIKALITNFYRGLLAMVAPTHAWRKAETSGQRGRIVAVHVVAVIVGIIGLSFLQERFQLDAFVRSSLPLVRHTWLPLVGVLFYALAWSAWFLAHTLRIPTATPVESDIAAAWKRGRERFARAGIDTTATPLYLVLGAPAGGIRDFFHASHTELTVVPSAEDANESVQVCGNREAIYVCCRDASLTGDYTRRAAIVQQSHSFHRSTMLATREPAQQWQARDMETLSDSLQSTVTPASLSTQNRQTAVLPTTTTLTANDAAVQRLDRTLAQLEVLTESEPALRPQVVLQPQRPTPPLLTLDAAYAAELLDRLDGLCREIAETRQPYCPINGVICVIPLHATDCIESADHLGMRIERDLQAIASATESAVSAQFVFCDLELSEGAQAFLDRFPDSQRHRRLGAILPATPASEPNAGSEAIHRAVSWICDQLFPPLGYRLMNRDGADEVQDRTYKSGNQQIHRMVALMRARKEGMARLLRRAITATSGQIRMRGCFIAATGTSSERRQAFAEGIMPLILDIQNEVQWIPRRRQRDLWQHCMAFTIYTGVAVSTVATILLGFGLPG